MASIKPIEDRIAIERLEEEEKTSGGIYLPDTAKEEQQKGKVIAVGPGKMREDGERTSPAVDEGDTVIFSKFGGTEVTIDGQELLLLRESDILAVIEE